MARHLSTQSHEQADAGATEGKAHAPSHATREVPAQGAPGTGVPNHVPAHEANPYEESQLDPHARGGLDVLAQRRRDRKRAVKRFTEDGEVEDVPPEELPERPSALRAGGERVAAAGRSLGASVRQRRAGRKPSGRTIRKRLGIALLVVFVALAACGFALYRSAVSVRSQAQLAWEAANVLDDDPTSGDYASLSSHVAQFADASASMHGLTASPLWSVATALPGVGRDAANMRTLAASLDDLSQNALVPFAGEAQGRALDDLAERGRINVDAVQGLVNLLGEVAPVIERNYGAVSALGHGSVGQLNDGIDATASALSGLNTLATQAQEVAAQVPAMLGANGTKTYLVVLQNGAVLHGAGGYPVTWGVVSITDGALQVGTFSDVAAEQEYAAEQVRITADERSLFGTSLATSAGYSSVTPDFTRAAKLMSGFWTLHARLQAANGTADGLPEQVDGVISVDPQFVQGLLGLVGPVSVDEVTLDGNNAAQALMSDAYWNNGAQGRASLFSGAMDGACQRLAQSLGSVDTSQLIRTFSEAGGRRDLLVWFSDSATERLFSKYAVAGAVGSDGRVGVYLNDLTDASAGWYLSMASEVSAASQAADGSQRYQVSVTLRNRMTDVVAQSAPDALVGGDYQRNPLIQGADHRGDQLVHVLLVAPSGGQVADLRVSEGKVSRDLGAVRLNGVQGRACEAYVPRGGSTRIDFWVTVPEGSGGIGVEATPTVAGEAG